MAVSFKAVPNFVRNVTRATWETFQPLSDAIRQLQSLAVANQLRRIDVTLVNSASTATVTFPAPLSDIPGSSIIVVYEGAVVRSDDIAIAPNRETATISRPGGGTFSSGEWMEVYYCGSMDAPVPKNYSWVSHSVTASYSSSEVLPGESNAYISLPHVIGDAGSMIVTMAGVVLDPSSVTADTDDSYCHIVLGGGRTFEDGDVIVFRYQTATVGG